MIIKATLISTLEVNLEIDMNHLLEMLVAFVFKGSGALRAKVHVLGESRSDWDERTD